MLVVRGTKELRDRVKTPVALDGDASTRLGDWFGAALSCKPQATLLVNQRTFVPVFVDPEPPQHPRNRIRRPVE